MKTTLIALFLAATASTAAYAQSAPVGGPTAKGNSAVKHAHTVNDGSAKPGHNSFTQAQAMRHIEHSGYTGVAGLVKGQDGIWRGTAMKNGAPVNVAMDFKGNVTQGTASMAARPAAPAMQRTTPVAPMPSGPSPASSTASPTEDASHHTMRHHRRHHHHRRIAGCATNPGPNGVACSGRDRNRNGVSDKEDRAMSHGAKP